MYQPDGQLQSSSEKRKGIGQDLGKANVAAKALGFLLISQKYEKAWNLKTVVCSQNIA